MSTLELYDYQTALANELRHAYRSGKRAPLLQLATGGGKTVIFSHVAQGAAAKNNRVLILAHRRELLDQISETLAQFSVPHGIINPDHSLISNAKVQVASVFTVARRLARIQAPDLIIVDEAHHTTLKSTWGKVIAAFPRARLLGVTATPTRLSGEGLGDVYDSLILGPTVEALVAAGRLSHSRVFAPPTIDVSSVRTRMGDYVASDLSAVVDKPTVTGDAIAHYKKLTPCQRAAVFCVSIEHATHIAAAARDAGISAVMIEGAMDKGVRRDVIRDFKAGHINWLVSVDLISEGFDCPGIEVGISLRPTQSLGLWLQQCGRVLRTFPGKTCATILDHAGNSLRHGLPTEERHWSLEGTARHGKGTRGITVRVCPRCFSAQRSGGGSCTSCGEPFKIEPRIVSRVEGTLEEITPEKIAARKARQEQGQAGSLEKLKALGRMKYGPGKGDRWAEYVWAGRIKKRTVGK